MVLCTITVERGFATGAATSGVAVGRHEVLDVLLLKPAAGSA
jgi:hypothetical protein